MPADLLEVLLQTELVGHRFEAVALRTRSKLAKSEVCRVLGYPIPKAFRKLKLQPRFPGQHFDTYVQSADNLQIWNAEISPMVGRSFENPGILQERNRGGHLHGLVSAALGYMDHSDNGRFPDVRHQLLEVKLQTSPTIDLGAISPDSEELLEFPAIGNVHVRHQDVRYAVFCGSATDDRVTITGLVLVTGKDFYATFEKFGGLVINNKYQLPLPRSFFDQNTEGIFD